MPNKITRQVHLKKQRTSIPAELADTIIFESDRACCICHKQKHIQIHHLDGDPSNNKASNLIVLCLEHHEEAGTQTNVTRKLSSGVLAKYRAEWHRIVQSRRETQFSRETRGVEFHDAYMEALACHEVRKLAFEFGNDWDIIHRKVQKIYSYVAREFYGSKLSHEVMDHLYGLACRTRDKMPVRVAHIIRSATSAALPIVSLVTPTKILPSKDHEELFTLALLIGHAMAHDGVKYLSDLKISGSGAGILHIVLRYAHLNKIERLEEQALLNFSHLLQVAQDYNDQEASRWITFERDDALALSGDPLPKYPEDVGRKVMGMPRDISDLLPPDPHPE